MLISFILSFVIAYLFKIKDLIEIELSERAERLFV